MKCSGSETNSEKRKWLSIFFRQVFVNTVELGKVTLKGDEHSDAPQNLLPGTSRPWPQTSRPYISDPVTPFNSTALHSCSIRQEWGSPLWQELLYMHVGECSSLYLYSLPTKSYTYHSPILQSLSQIPTLELWHEDDSPREMVSPSSNSLSSLKTPNIYS